MGLVVYSDKNLGEILRMKLGHVPHIELSKNISPKNIKTSCKVWTINTHHHEKYLVSVTPKLLSTLMRVCKSIFFCSNEWQFTVVKQTLLPRISKSPYDCAYHQFLFSIDIVRTHPFEILVLKFIPPPFFSYGQLMGGCP